MPQDVVCGRETPRSAVSSFGRGRMRNPGGYLYRVGQSAARRYRRRQAAMPDPGGPPQPADVDLERALLTLSPRQRAAVLLVHGHGYTLEEAASAMGCSVSTLRNHIRRGLDGLRRRLGGDDDG